MRVLSTLLLGACWTGATPQPPPAPRAVSGKCEIHDVDVVPQEALNLQARGTTFATLGERIQRLDVTVTDHRARANLEIELVELDADLKLDDAWVRPVRGGLHASWLELTRANLIAAKGGTVRVGAKLPDGFEPRVAMIDLPCNELTFVEPSEEKPMPENARSVAIVPGVSAKLRATPGGPVVATVTGSKRGNDEAGELVVLEQRGPLVRLRWSRPNAVFAWTEATAIRDQEGNLYGGLTGNMRGVAGHRIECQQAVPLYVRVGSEEVRVGRLKPNVKFPPDYRGGDLEIDLGVEDVKPYVKKADMPTCLGSR